MQWPWQIGVPSTPKVMRHFVINDVRGPRHSVNNGSPKGKSLRTWPLFMEVPWSKGVIEYKGQDWSLAIGYLPWSMVHMFLCWGPPCDAQREVTACKVLAHNKGQYWAKALRKSLCTQVTKLTCNSPTSVVWLSAPTPSTTCYRVKSNATHTLDKSWFLHQFKIEDWDFLECVNYE